MTRSEHMREMGQMPGMRAVAAVATGALAGALIGRAREGVLVGLGAAMAVRSQAAGAAALDRAVRCAEDATTLIPVVGKSAPRLGGWAIEADFGRLLGREVEAGPELVVELGSGISTLLLAAALDRRGSGQLISFDHHPQFAAQTAELLDSHAHNQRATVVEAPLCEQRFGDVSTWWYDPEVLAASLPQRPIDLLVVDGPPSTGTWSRWPAIEFFLPRLAPDAVVLLDDGRRREETRTAQRWAKDHPGLRLAWLDTVKGTWRLEVGESAPHPLPRRLALNLRAAVNPHPIGFRREPVPR